MTGIKAFFGAKTRIAATALALGLLALASITIPALGGDGGTLLARSSDALGNFIGRSPGERRETDLLKGKQSLTKQLAQRINGHHPKPEERALGKIFDTPPEDSVRAQDAPAPLDLGDPGPSTVVPLADLGDLGAPGGTGSGPPSNFPGGITTVIPPGSTGTPSDPTIPDPPPPIPAVPEPGTWALMLIGLGVCGAVLRRQRKSAPAGSPGPIPCEAA